MNTFTSLLVPLSIAIIGIYGLIRRVDVYDALIYGARDGIHTLLRILPSITALFCAIYMLRASGALDFMCLLLAPIMKLFKIPSECTPLVLLRPLSGSAGLAFGSDIIKSYGVDSYIGRCASVMLGASETTFYTIAVYFGSLRLDGMGRAVAAALCADFAGFVAAAFAVRIFF